MSQSRFELKVGVFVLIALVLLAALLIAFSKGVTRFSRTYELYLKTTDVGGIMTGANVLMAGYPIGNVAELELAPDGNTVTVQLQIKQEYRIHTNALFVIEQSGFLGDQFVAIYHGKDTNAPYLEDGDVVICPPPFNLQQTARDASGFIRRIDDAARKLNETIADVRTHVLNQETLTNLAITVENMRSVSERALVTVDDIQTLINTNRVAISGSLSNFGVFSEQLNGVAVSLSDVISTNSTSVSDALKNVESASEVMKSLLDDLQAGKGLAGAVLRDPQLANSVSTIAENLSVTSSNLNRLGLWGILWSKKPARAPARSESPLESPRASDQ